MTLTDYHEICRTRQAEVCLSFSQKNVKVGAVYLDIATQPSIGDCPEIVSSYLDDLKCDGWQVTRQPTTMQPLGFKMESGWTRVHSSVVARDVKIRASFSSSQSSQNWLTQANFVFNCLKNLQIEPALADYKDVLLIETVIYFVDKDPSFNCPDIPSGYLFLCPLVNLQSDKASKSLEYAAYWSPDPSGATRMNAEQAETAGFPRLRWVVTVEYCRWEENVYAGLRTFHTGKGFDPDSQDLARHLGYPLYKVPSDIGSEIPLVQGRCSE
ncbi:hypothetical protein B0H19DRAFT_480780 [Mycena capillaripes]|nr:hypothetical protein B0H19DRAFT_480780 [Mycena capillaripes]